MEKLDESKLKILSEIIDKKVYKKKEEKDYREKEVALQKQYWRKGEDYMICRPCTKYSSLPEVPLELLRSKRGYRGCPFRMIKKSGKGEECRGCDITSNGVRSRYQV